MNAKRRDYKNFKERVERLATSLLPNDRADGRYLEAEEDRIRAYIVLAHAEVEGFIEELARSTLERARRRSTGNTCDPILSRLIHLKAVQDKSSVGAATEESMRQACEHYEKVLQRNNGIKSANLLTIFMPLGLTHEDFDVVLLASLDAFGRLRGTAAHTSARLKQGSSPSSEKKSVDQILSGLSALDQRVRSLIRG